ncbi:hypothetical protein, partial [Bradyrhizobium japonicum]|uniref:hypothetical protein n=1 Tax=Bradyrhizobium japonicum TaxID=375 RepID=UPI001AEBEC6F
LLSEFAGPALGLGAARHGLSRSPQAEHRHARPVRLGLTPLLGFHELAHAIAILARLLDHVSKPRLIDFHD